MTRLSPVPLIAFAAGTAVQAWALIESEYSASLEPLRMTWVMTQPALAMTFSVVQALPITHSCFGFNAIEASVFYGLFPVMGGMECALAVFVVESCCLVMQHCVTRWQARP